jgi:hypothetical protein
MKSPDTPRFLTVTQIKEYASRMARHMAPIMDGVIEACKNKNALLTSGRSKRSNSCNKHSKFTKLHPYKFHIRFVLYVLAISSSY